MARLGPREIATHSRALLAARALVEPVLLHLALERLERAVRRLGDGHEVLDVPRLGQPARRCYPDLVRPCRGPV